MNPYLLVVVVVAYFAAGLAGFRLGVDHQKAQEVEKTELVAEAVDAANAASAAVLASIRPKYTTIQNQVEKQIETNTVYRDCRLDPVGLQLANQALNGGSKPSSGGELPKADAPPK